MEARGVAVDQSSGELYAADAGNRRISKFDAEGRFLLAWGWGVADGTSQELQTCGPPPAGPPPGRCFEASSDSSAAGSIQPRVVAVDNSGGPGQGDVYAIDANRRRVAKFTPSGHFIFMVGRNVNKTKKEELGPGAPYSQAEKDICTAADLQAGDLCGAGESGTEGAEFANPASLAIDSSGRVWVGDADRIASFGPDGSAGPDVPLPGAGGTNSLAVDSAGHFFTVKRATLERQTISFDGLANGETFVIGDLPAACSAPSTGPIEYVDTTGEPGKVLEDGGANQTKQNIFAALEAECGAGSFDRKGAVGTRLAAITLYFEGLSAGLDVAPLTCTTSGSGSCPVATEYDGSPGKVQERDGVTGEVIETISEGGQPFTLTLDGEDNLYLGDATFPYRLVKFSPAGEKVSQFGAGRVIGEPTGNALALDEGSTAPGAEREAALYTANSSGYIDDSPISKKEETVVQRFSLPEPGPLPGDPRAEDILPTSATLKATLNPEGHATRYRFEYDTSPYQGAAPHGTAIPAPDATLPGTDFEEEPVSVDLRGLLPDTTYHFRLTATDRENPACAEEECTVHGPDTTFTTPPAVGIEAQWVSEVGARDATVNGRLDPLGAPGEWWLEYDTSPYAAGEAPHGTSVPLPRGVLPESSGEIPLAVPLRGLEPATAYHYRFVGRDEREVEEGGETLKRTFTAHGPDRSFATQPAGLDFAPADSRAWEMVSPPDKHGGRIVHGEQGAFQAAAAGDGVAYLSQGPLVADPEGSRLLESSSTLSRRVGASSWSSEDLSPPHRTAVPFPLGNAFEYKLFSPDLGLALMDQRDAGALLSPAASERTPYLRANTERPVFTPLVSGAPGHANVPPGTVFGGDPERALGSVSVVNATPDLDHAVLSSEVPLAAGAADGALYMWEAGALSPASVPPAGEGAAALAGKVGSGEASVRGAVSADGSRLFWTSLSTGRLYVRDLAREESARLDVVQEGAFGTGQARPSFWGADAAGESALFTDTRNLTEDANEVGADLYRCELRAGGGSLGCDLSDLTADTRNPADPFEGADVEAFFGVSEDAASLYFLARGVLDPAANREGESAAPGGLNLYLWREGAGSRFIATLSEDDAATRGRSVERSAAVSPSGRYLAFMSKRPLTGYDNRDLATGERAQEVFRYDARSEELACVSCNPSGARPRALTGGRERLPWSDPQNVWQDQPLAAVLPEVSEISQRVPSPHRPRVALDNGRVFFDAFDSLVAADSNGRGDVYEYEPEGVGGCTPSAAGAGTARAAGGCVALLSSGVGREGAAFLDASRSGEDVFFFTDAPLSVADEDEETDVYDARVHGVAARLPESAECQGEACQPPPAAPEAPTPASAAFRGPGNPGNAGGRGAAASRCSRAAGRARGLSRRAKGLRRRAERSGVARLRRRASRLARAARRQSRRASRCRRRASRTAGRKPRRARGSVGAAGARHDHARHYRRSRR